MPWLDLEMEDFRLISYTQQPHDRAISQRQHRPIWSERRPKPTAAVRDKIKLFQQVSIVDGNAYCGRNAQPASIRRIIHLRDDALTPLRNRLDVICACSRRANRG